MDLTPKSDVRFSVAKSATKSATWQACDACRRRKRKCSFGTDGILEWKDTARASGPVIGCDNCEKSGSLCTFLLPLKARGPKRKTSTRPDLGPPGPSDDVVGAEVDMPNGRSPFSQRSFLSLSPYASENSMLLAEPAIETTPPTWCGPTYPTDVLCPRSLVLYILGDYLKYVYPLLPVIHRPTFENDLNDDRDRQDEGFAMLIICLCAATVGFLPSRFQSYLDFTPPLAFPTRTDMIAHCHKIHQSFKDTQYYDTISHQKWASNFSLGLAFFQIGKNTLWRMLDVEAMQLLRFLEVQHISSYAGLDAIEVQLRKKAFWLMFFGYVHSMQNLRNEWLNFLDHSILRRTNLEDLIPSPVDDEFITTDGISPCAEAVAATSLTAGFITHLRVFCAALERPESECPGCTDFKDPALRLVSLKDRLHHLTYMLDTVEPPYSLWNQRAADDDDVENIQREAIRANIHITHLWLQSALLDQMEAILSQQKAPASNQEPLPPVPSEVSVDSLWDKKEDICRQMLQALYSFNRLALEPNGLSVVSQHRT